MLPNGFSEYEKAVLSGMGFSDEEVEEIRQAILDKGISVPPQGSTPFDIIAANQAILADASVCAGSSCVLRSGVIAPEEQAFEFMFEGAGLGGESFIDIFFGDDLFASFSDEDLRASNGVLSVILGDPSLLQRNFLPFHVVARNQLEYTAVADGFVVNAVAPVPTPASGLLLLSGLAGLVMVCRKKRGENALASTEAA